jgi:hypothetical protein
MNKVSIAFAIAILCVTCVPVYAQTGVTGTWRVESSPPFEIFLKAEGATLTGVMSYCSSRGPVAIYDGTITGTTIAFSCRSLPDNDRTVTFTGTIKNDEIVFAWKAQVREGGNPFVDTSAFAPSAPPRYTARRVPNSELARLADLLGTEFAVAVNFPEKDLKVTGTLFLPEGVSRVRAVIVAIAWGLGDNVYRDPELRKLVKTTDSGLIHVTFGNMGPGVDFTYRNLFNQDAVDGLVVLLQRFAQESGRPELADVPLVLWGHSAAGGFGPRGFLSRYPQRTIALVLYHANAGDLSKTLSETPTLIFKGGKDTVGPNTSEDSWKRARSAGAPWTFAFEPNATHSDTQALSKANHLLIPWLTAVLRQRLPSTGRTLRPVTDGTAFLGNTKTGEVAPYGTFSGSKAEANWLPDEASALGWRNVQEDETRSPAPPSNAQIVTDREGYLTGEAISVSFKGAPGNSKDWIGIYPSGVQPGTRAATLWFYVNGTRNATTGQSEGTVKFPAGVSVGDWVAYLLLNDGYTIAATSVFKVEK